MAWIRVEDAKLHLNKTNTADDLELDGFINAACRMIERIKGHVDTVTVTGERQRARRINLGGRRWRDWSSSHYGYLLDLDEQPVASITSVGRYDGAVLTSIAADDPLTGTAGWMLDDTVLYVPSYGEYSVTYVAGQNPVDPDFRLAALELTAHLWRDSQLNKTGVQPVYPSDQMMSPQRVVSAMPFRVRELLGIYGDVVNDHVVIA